MEKSDRRREAEKGTKPALSRFLLEKMPYLVAHPTPSRTPGLFYQDEQLGGAISCTAEEAMLLCYLAAHQLPEEVLEIGCATGWSTAHLCIGATGAARITAVDPFVEESGRLRMTPNWNERLRFMQNMENCGVNEQIVQVADFSPRCISKIAPKKGFDLVFIDGWHYDKQPLADVVGILPHCHAKTVIVFHDTWIPDVGEAVNALSEHNWQERPFPTPGYMVVCYRTRPKWWLSFIDTVTNELFYCRHLE